jgi:hypothetical protein
VWEVGHPGNGIIYIAGSGWEAWRFTSSLPVRPTKAHVPPTRHRLAFQRHALHAGTGNHETAEVKTPQRKWLRFSESNRNWRPTRQSVCTCAALNRTHKSLFSLLHIRGGLRGEGRTWALKGAEYGGTVFSCGATEMPADGQQAGADVYTTPYLTRRLSRTDPAADNTSFRINPLPIMV